jgi:NUMOD4 motif/NUMOD1 domain
MNNKINYKQILTLANLPGEQWKDIPSLDGAYEISNYGRVKTLRRWVERASNGGFWKKESILTNSIAEKTVSNGKRTNYLLRKSVGYENKKYSFQIGRLVYYLFVRKFKLEDRSIFIGYKDGNPFNVHYDNLLLTSPSKTITTAYQKKYRTRDSFGNKAMAVVQYDKNGKKLSIYESVYHASQITGLGIGAITSQLNYGIGYTGGFIWKYEKDTKNKEIVTDSIRNKLASETLHNEIVTQYDLNGTKLKEFENINAAAKVVKCQVNQLRYVVLGKISTAAGYYWRLGKGEPKVSVSHLRKGRQKWRKRICRPVTQYDLQGNMMSYYSSIAEAASKTGILGMTIFSAVKEGGSRTCKGYIFRYGKGKKKISIPQQIKRKLQLAALYEQPITQYTFEGKRVAIHENLKAAAKKMKGQVYGIVYMLSGKLLSYKGFYWQVGKGKMTTNVDDLQKAITGGIKKMPRPVVQYSIDGKKIKEYTSAMAAEAATGIYSTQIGLVVRGMAKTAKGFKWRYKNE